MTTITQIDREITANRRDLLRREKIDRLSAESWQAAWDQWPVLWQREQNLFRMRGEAQLERDQKAAKAAAKPRRQKRPRKCPTCGNHTISA